MREGEWLLRYGNSHTEDTQDLARWRSIRTTTLDAIGDMTLAAARTMSCKPFHEPLLLPKQRLPVSPAVCVSQARSGTKVYGWMPKGEELQRVARPEPQD